MVQASPNDYLACGDENVFVSGYVDHRGKLVKDLDLKEIQKAIELFKEKNITSCAVVTKFCTRNFNHELKIKKLLEKHFSPSITMGIAYQESLTSQEGSLHPI